MRASPRAGRVGGIVLALGAGALMAVGGADPAYQGAFYAAGIDPRMGDISPDYLGALDAAGMDLYVDFQFTGQAGPTPWGDFAKLHRMDEALTDSHRYGAVTAAADGSLWSGAL